MGNDLFGAREGRCIGVTLLAFLCATAVLVPLEGALADPPAPPPEEAGLSGTGSVSAAPDQGESGLGDMAADTDRTKPVMFGFRDEFYDLGHGLW